ncbi:hypothetical protein [Microbacterium atlanticum]|uniref:hypothetical protein n=1 Tax=Microbacterium atlanticum TaxID=2782168 RepID=UPI001889AF76|nr:hypothetical protein [Microbacterium atlanticum]
MTGTLTPGVAPAPQRSGGTATIVGIVLLIVGLLVAAGGGAVLFVGVAAAGIQGMQAGDGYISAGGIEMSTDSYALTSPARDALTMHGDVSNLPFDVAALRLTVESADEPVFVGIAAQADIDRYLSDVQHSEVRRLDFRSDVRYREHAGSAPSAAPGDLDIWIASASGSGPQEVTWTLTPGTWGIVVMNADGAPGVDVEMSAGARSDLIAPAATALLVLGGILLAVGTAGVIAGVVLLVVGQRGLRSPGDAGAGRPPRMPQQSSPV